MDMTGTPFLKTMFRIDGLAIGRRLALFLLPSWLLLTASVFAKQRGPATLDLEEALARADLVLAARVADVSASKTIFGGKAEHTIQQFQFEPLGTLKGVFARKVLALTSDDLGTGRFAGDAGQIERGQLRLLILGRSGPGYANTNEAETLDRSLPLLHGPDDPLLKSVAALIAVSQQHDRQKRVALLLAALREARGNAAIPLLESLRRRALLVAQTAGAMATLPQGRLTAEMQEVVAKTLLATLEADYLDQHELREAALAAVVALLEPADPAVAARAVTLDALGAVGESARRDRRALAWLRADRPSLTYAEQAARFRAIARLGLRDQRDAVVSFFDPLPLDAPGEIQAAAGRSLVRLDPAQAAESFARRLQLKHDAQLDLRDEIDWLAGLPADLAVPVLIKAATWPLDRAERVALARASTDLADPRLIPLLAKMLDPRQPDVRWHASEALRKIDTDEAAQTLRPHLAEETDLLRKLQLAESLGRHGIRDGYPYAIEHLSEPGLLEQAIAALAAIREPKAGPALRTVWETSNDQAWNIAAVRALGRLGQSECAPRMLELVQDLRNPLAPSALIALGDIGEARVLPIVRRGFSSRSDEIVIACARATARLLARPEVRADDLRDRLASLLADSDASQPTRSAALDALVALNDSRLDRALASAVRDARLEGSDLLQRIEHQLGRRKTRLSLP